MERDHVPNGSQTVRLVRASQAGDLIAYERLIRRHLPEAVQTAVGVLTRAETAAEVVADSLALGYRRISRLVLPQRFRFWILGIVLEQALSRRAPARRRAELTRLFIRAGLRRHVIRPGSGRSAADGQTVVERAMLCLSGNEVGAVALCGLGTLSDGEVGDVMGCSVRRLQWYMHRGRPKLRLSLAPYLKPGNESLDRLLHQVWSQEFAGCDCDHLTRAISARLVGLSRAMRG